MKFTVTTNLLMTTQFNMIYTCILIIPEFISIFSAVFKGINVGRSSACQTLHRENKSLITEIGRLLFILLT